MATKDAKQADNEGTTGALLSAQERETLQQISAGEAPFSQRAQALMALDEGTTQAAAGERAGLTSGQVKYWLDKFRKGGIDIFPESEPELAAPEAEVEEAPEAAKGKKPKAKKGKKPKKAKKPKKKAKKDKGAKKSKKGKKGKSSASKSKKKSKKKKKKK